MTGKDKNEFSIVFVGEEIYVFSRSKQMQMPRYDDLTPPTPRV